MVDRILESVIKNEIKKIESEGTKVRIKDVTNKRIVIVIASVVLLFVTAFLPPLMFVPLIGGPILFCRNNVVKHIAEKCKANPNKYIHAIIREEMM